MKKAVLIFAITIFTQNIMAQKKIVQTAGREQLGEFAPEFARLNDDILFGEVWSRNDLLSLRPCHHNITYQSWNHRQFTPVPSAIGQKQRNHTHGNCRNNHPHGILCRMA